MDNSTINNILNFLVTNEGKKLPEKWVQFKLENNIPLTKEELKVGGNLDLYGSKIESLPEELYVAGTLVLSNCKNLTSLPKRLKVGEDLHLDYTKIISLPEGLYVGGNLFLIMCENLKSLPKGLKVGVGLNITDSSLTKYTEEELRKMIEPGFIKGSIIRR
jgi:hypothetical protein